MMKPLELAASVAASGYARSQGIPLVRARSVSITARVTYDASATAGADIEVYYSPDGTNWDTEPYGSAAMAFTAGATKQATSFVLMPEHGYAKFAVKNNDASYTITNATIWYSIQSWPEGEGMARGRVDTDERRD